MTNAVPPGPQPAAAIHRTALTALDAAFLHVESDRTPMHMASVGVFDGRPFYDADGSFRIDDVRALIAGRLGLVPKLRQRAREGFLGEAPPVWVDDPDFEISRHVRVQQLQPPGTELELCDLCAELLAGRLEPTRPLWELTFIEGLSEGRVALIERLHHSMADGLAASELATVLLDLSPVSLQSEEVRPWRPDARPPAWRAALDDLLRLANFPVRWARWSGRSMLHPIRRTREAAELVGAVSTLATAKLIAPRSSLNSAITQSRSVTFVRLPFAEVQEVARSFEVTINDVLLTVVAGGLRDLLVQRNELTENAELQVLVPVGQVKAESRGLANDVSALFVRLPISMDDPVKVLNDGVCGGRTGKASPPGISRGHRLATARTPAPEPLGGSGWHRAAPAVLQLGRHQCARTARPALCPGSQAARSLSPHAVVGKSEPCGGRTLVRGATQSWRAQQSCYMP